jgi:bifunctional non-homologous end joining protein LigD
MDSPTTVNFPVELPVVKRGEHWIARAGERELRMSNLDKVFWPEEGYNKADLLTYYFNISPVMLPHLIDRPLTMKRMPNGVHGDFFYEKNAPRHKPAWMPTIPVFSSDTQKTINFLTVHDVAHVLWMVNLGCIEFHPLHAKGVDQQHPSYAFFDLDPFEPAGWAEVAHVAGLIKVVLDQLGIKAHPKTSGATGMQIMVPLDSTLTFGEVRGFVGTISDMVHEVDPSTTTLEWEVRNRSGKVFLDVNMNRSGANIAGAYSVRPEPGATVSTPLRWEEIADVHPRDFSIETIFERVAEVGDPFLPVAEGPGQSLQEAIATLGAEPRKARVIRRDR